AAPTPTKPADASERHHGARAPSSQGRQNTPRAPGSPAAASSASSDVLAPVRPASQSSREPAPDRPPSSNQPRSAARDTTNPAGAVAGHPAVGTDTLAVVPQDTIGAASVAPTPMTSQARSP